MWAFQHRNLLQPLPFQIMVKVIIFDHKFILELRYFHLMKKLVQFHHFVRLIQNIWGNCTKTFDTKVRIWNLSLPFQL